MATNPTEQLPPTAGPGRIAEVISAAGAILVVGLGLAFVFVITLVSLGTIPDEQKSTIVAAAFSVIGTSVGTYFGVRAGAAGKQDAEAARDLEALKVQELAASVDQTTAQSAFERAEGRAETARAASNPRMPSL
ncbi:MAG: hypothetical protein ACR2GL_03375 [Thermoleophilaceae bacterium]